MVRTNSRRALLAFAVLIAVALLAGCTGEPAANAGREAGERLHVIASTSIVGDVVAQVGGDAIDLQVLMTAGQDPHSYEPTARDIAGVEGADVIFVNGFDLEETLLTMLRSTGAGVPIVPVSDGVEPISAGEHEDDEHEDDEHAHGEFDPHVWMNPLNVVIWAENIAAALAELDPANAGTYDQNAAAYADELRALDAEIEAALSGIPEAQRRIVTNHEALAYFAERYGLTVIGTVYEGASGLAEPNAGDLARLVQAIEEQHITALFVETSVSDDLARVVAEEIGPQVGVYSLYTGALGEPGSGADSYLGMMRANIETIVSALGS